MQHGSALKKTQLFVEDDLKPFLSLPLFEPIFGFGSAPSLNKEITILVCPSIVASINACAFLPPVKIMVLCRIRSIHDFSLNAVS